jgi:hypothetical protein
VLATHKRVSRVENSFFDQDRGCELAAFVVNVALNGEALGSHGVILHEAYLLVSQTNNLLFKQFDIHSLLRGDGHATDISSQVFGNDIVACQVEHHRINISFFSVDFVDGHNKRYSKLVDEINNFNCLSLYALNR